MVFLIWVPGHGNVESNKKADIPAGTTENSMNYYTRQLILLQKPHLLPVVELLDRSHPTGMYAEQKLPSKQTHSSYNRILTSLSLFGAWGLVKQNSWIPRIQRQNGFNTLIVAVIFRKLAKNYIFFFILMCDLGFV